MYRIDIKNVKELHSFLALDNNDFVDLIINGDRAVFVLNNSELFATITMPVVNVDEPAQFSTGVSRKLLADLVTEGYMQVSVDKTEVTLQFFEIREEYNAELTCALTTRQRDIFTESYYDKLNMLVDFDLEPTIDLSKLSSLASMGSRNRCGIDCNFGIACLNASDSLKVCKTIAEDLNFSVSATVLLTLLRFNTKAFQLKNFIGTSKGSIVILCSTIRGNTNEAYATVQERKASFRANISLEYLIRLINSVKFTTNFVTLDLSTNSCVIQSDTKRFTVPVMVRNLEKSPACSSCVVNIPIDVLKLLSKFMSGSVANVQNKRNFIQLNTNEGFIIYRS